ncbi:Kynureninase 1 [Claviceps digitariae]|nr:Kynureninase 1 [Claviceps digitariae]
MENSPLTQWQDMAEQCAKQSAGIVGASPHEIVIMNTLTVNLHLMMASFYRPSGKRHKIILEWKPFPSDHYAIESQVVWHGLDPKTSMVKIEPDANSVIPTDKILRTIDEHADETALLMLPGIQYYSGQLFDMPKITAYAKERGIVVGWDLAHAAGNVELKLHEWDVDFACWCTYKYINAGPGAIGGVYVHERFGKVDWQHEGASKPSYQPRLMGWYGGDKSVRFNMDNNFVPTPGAAGYQLSNPSALDLAALSGALSVFNKTTMHDIRSKSLVMTAYAEFLLDQMLEETKTDPTPLFTILTPRDPLQRGTQLSVLLRDGLLEQVSAALEENGAICDKRKPNVIRVAPVPLYTRFEDVWAYVQILRRALGLAALDAH